MSVYNNKMFKILRNFQFSKPEVLKVIHNIKSGTKI